MEVSSPTERHREALFTGLSSEYLVARDVDWSDLAKRTAVSFLLLAQEDSHLFPHRVFFWAILLPSSLEHHIWLYRRPLVIGELHEYLSSRVGVNPSALFQLPDKEWLQYTRSVDGWSSVGSGTLGGFLRPPPLRTL